MATSVTPGARARALPVISIIVAAYNSERTILEAIASVQAQTTPDWELIVVDDGSTDSTAHAVVRCASGDSRIRLIRQPNAGTAMARNAGAAHARGLYWVFLDADDVLLDDYIESQTAFIAANAGFDIYSCNAAYLLGDGGRRPVWRGPRYARPFSLTAEDQFAESSILLMATISPRVFELTGGFRALHVEDYDFWLRALLSGATHIYNPQVLALYRRHVGQRTRSLVTEAEGFRDVQREALSGPGLTESQRRAGEAAVGFSEARVTRRMLEEALLAGEYAGARRRYWSARRGFPGRLKYVLGLLVIGVSPRLYARIKASRMI